MEHIIANPVATHPHAYTLGLLRVGIETLPPSFDEGKIRSYREAVERFERRPDTPYKEIRDIIVRIGKESWAERNAYQDMYSRYGRSSEESFLLENLDQGIRGKYEQFIHDGGKLDYIERVRSEEDLLSASPFERYFTPEEKFAIEQALMVARDRAREEITALVTKEKQDEYGSLIRDLRESEARMDAMVKELRSYVGISERWDPVLEDRIRTIEEGWSIVEAGLDEKRLAKELEYWRGTLESFLHE